MSKLEKLVEDLSALSVLEAAELSKLLEEKWGVSAAAPVAVAASPAAGAAAATGAAAETPHFSSSNLESCAASRTDRLDNSSTILSRSAIVRTP